MDFSNKLLKWYGSNARDLPWRNTSNPYFIWISEVILQQTRVNQGIPYYYRFIEEFPTVQALADAPIDKLMKVWQGLGYYSRARNLKEGAIQIVNEFHGQIPNTFDELLKIKGIGPYSAAAIASFAFGRVVPAVDGNVYRILARVFGVFTPIDSSKGKKEFFELAKELISKKEPGRFNQAIIDFGALQCTPKSPLCIDCPFNEYCYAYQNNLISSLPVKGIKKPPQNRFFYYFMIRYGNFTFVRRRSENDIWNSLYEFPLWEHNKQFNFDEIGQKIKGLSFLKDTEPCIRYISEPVKHVLSHRIIWATFIILKIEKANYSLKADYVMIPIEELSTYPFPRLIDGYLAAEPTAKYFINRYM
ncbi:A/G-specific adenine glycosylase [Tenuifilum thalassicum]|uniref:Adenine DNA glycosylase n=2 Tax=Tenuifilum thalassicum TaxID=2590900 RepID=A0A7D4BCX1_9BACT|nr:A/G-specific adenine glycosylase [Tenuifilum thalassicum]